MACNYQTLFGIFDLVCVSPSASYIIIFKVFQYMPLSLSFVLVVIYIINILVIVVHTETLIDGEPILKLPPKTIQLSKIDFTPEERAFYLTLEEGSRQKFKVPSTLHHLSSVGYQLNSLT